MRPAAVEGVNLVGYLRAEMGVGESGRLALAALRAVGIPVAARTISTAGLYREEDMRAGPDAALLHYRLNLLYVNADQTPAVAASLGSEALTGRHNVWYWAWEVECFPERWARAFAYCDEIWTPSSFSALAISRLSPVPVVPIPHCVRVEVPGGLGRTHFGLPQDQFLFLTVFDALSVVERKNPGAVIEAFRRAFDAGGRCHLVVKVNNGQYRRQELQALRSHSGPAVTIIDGTVSRSEMNALTQSCDCLVSLHRAEGFGLSLAEAMFLGKPVIATAYSGNMDFTKPDNAFLVGYRMKRVGEGCAPYDPDLQWADPDVDEAARLMRTVFECDAVRQERAARGRDFVRQHLSPEAVGGIMRQRLAIAVGRPPRLA